MKKHLFLVTALSLALFASSCGDANQKTSVIPQIDMNDDYPEKEICLQDIAEVSYIPLETTDEMLFEGTIVELSKDGIVGVDKMNDRLLLFYPDGKARLLLSHKGEGPQEYVHLGDVVVDWKREEIYISHRGGERIQVYSLEGGFKRTLEVNEFLRQNDMYHFDDNHLLAFKEKMIKGGYNKSVEPYRPIVLISKEDGRVDSLSYIKDYIASLVITNLSAQAYISSPVYVKSGSLTYLSDMGADTIYTIGKDGSISSYMTRTPSVVKDEEGDYFLCLSGVSSNYDFINKQAKTLELGSDFVARDEKTHDLIRDKRSGEIFRSEFKNLDCPSLDVDLRFVTGYDNCAHYPLEAFDLIEALEAGELSGELKAIAEGLKEDDNPVLMVVKFKE